MSSKIYILLITFLFFTAVLTQIDSSCKDVKCVIGFKCESGLCIRKEYPYKKKFFTLNYSMRIKCKDFEKYKCDKSKLIVSCGITAQGVKKNFIDDCSPCLDTKIIYFFKLPCIKIPKICASDEDFVNGECVKLKFSNIQKESQSCETAKDCKKIGYGYTCVSSKCLKLTQVVSILQKTSIPNIEN